MVPSYPLAKLGGTPDRAKKNTGKFSAGLYTTADWSGAK
jgi:hypothetical protein